MDDKVVAMVVIGGLLVCAMFKIPTEAPQLVNMGIGIIGGFVGGAAYEKAKRSKKPKEPKKGGSASNKP